MAEVQELGPTSLRWLTGEGFSVEQGSKSEFSAFYSIYSPTKPEYRVSISQAKGDDKLVLGAGVMLGENEKGRLRQLPDGKKTELIIALSALLHGRSIAFQIQHDQGTIKQIYVSKALYSDGFTKDRLMTIVNEIFAAQTMIILTLAEFFATLKASGDITSARTKQAPATSACSRCGASLLPNAKFCGSCGHKVG